MLTPWGTAGENNGGPHGLSEILYAYSSCTGNNGSAFAGLTGNPTNGDPHYNITLAFATLIGRFGMIIPVMALAGSLGPEEAHGDKCRYISGIGHFVRDLADRNHPARGCTNLPASANTYPDSRALPDVKRKAILSDDA